MHGDPEEEKNQLAVEPLEDPPGTVKLRVEDFPVKGGRFEGIAMKINGFIPFNDPDELDHPLQFFQLLRIVVGKNLLLHPPLVFQLLPAFKKLKLVHHLEDFAHHHVMDSAHAADSLIDQPIPVHVTVGDHLDHGLIKVEKLRDFLLLESASLGSRRLGDAHETAVSKQVEGLLGLVGPGQLGERLEGLFVHLSGKDPGHRRMADNNQVDLLEFARRKTEKGKTGQVVEHGCLGSFNAVRV